MQVLLAGDDTPIQMVRVGEAAWATQFHPEKSSDAGAAVLRNFVEIAKAASPALQG